MSTAAAETYNQSTSTCLPHIANELQTISLKIEFSGGLEILFSNQRSHQILIPAHVPSDLSIYSKYTNTTGFEGETKAVDVSYLLFWLRDNLLKERVELFLEGETVSVFYIAYSDQK